MISLGRGHAQRIDGPNMRSDWGWHGTFRCRLTHAFARGTRVSLGLTAVCALVACHGEFGSSRSYSADPSTVSRPIINLAPNPNRVVLGGATTLEWNASAAESCVASGGWSGPRAITGLASVSN